MSILTNIIYTIKNNIRCKTNCLQSINRYLLYCYEYKLAKRSIPVVKVLCLRKYLTCVKELPMNDEWVVGYPRVGSRTSTPRIPHFTAGVFEIICVTLCINKYFYLKGTELMKKRIPKYLIHSKNNGK